MVSVEECKRMVTERKFRLPTGLDVDVPLKQEIQINYFEKGIVTSEKSNWPSNEKEASCEGARVFLDGGGYIDNVVVSVNMKIRVEEERFKGDNSETEAKFSQLSLPCSIRSESCSTAEGTFVWDLIARACPGFVVARDNIQGFAVTEENGEEYFISNDKSLIRVRLLGIVTRCDRVFHSTPQEGMFVFELGQGSGPIVERVEQDELKLFAFVKNRDDFLYNDIRDQLEGELTYMREMDCRQRLASRRVDFFLQMKLKGLTSVYLGNGTFATAAGETLHTYACEEILVRARDTNTCYDVLPVQKMAIRSGKRFRLKRPDLSKKNVTAEWFMEPLTHRLTNVAVQQPCSKVFVNKYRNTNGIWMSASPSIQFTGTPHDFGSLQDLVEAAVKRPDFEHRDYSQGGIYSEETLKDYNQRLEQHRVVTAVMTKMATNANSQVIYGGSASVGPDKLFPEVSVPWYSGVWEHLVSWYETWGLLCASLFGVYTSVCILHGMYRAIVRIVFLRKVEASLPQLLYRLFCLHLFLEKEVEGLKREGRPTYRAHYQAGRDDDSDVGKFDGQLALRDNLGGSRSRSANGRLNRAKREGVRLEHRRGGLSLPRAPQWANDDDAEVSGLLERSIRRLDVGNRSMFSTIRRGSATRSPISRRDSEVASQVDLPPAYLTDQGDRSASRVGRASTSGVGTMRSDVDETGSI